VTLLQLFVIAVVQGLTEFLPISSSAHLILVPQLTGWQDQGLAIDIAVHVGTLFAVLLYFHRDVLLMLRGLLDLLRGRWSEGGRLMALVALATVPVVLVGLIFKLLGIQDALRSVEVIIVTTIGFGILLWVVDRRAPDDKGIESFNVRSALLIGLAQALAPIPGTSRSGITITAARWLGFRRTEAARISMLLSIPTILAAGSLLGLDLYQAETAALTRDALIAGALAFGTALLAIWGMMRWLQTASYTPFVVYRMLLGLALIAWLVV
tara:strand:- start:315 stop:1115 length:801 start_codon:yes stop_codon:yes gene_type:complete